MVYSSKTFMANNFFSIKVNFSIDRSMSVTKITTSSKFLIVYDVTLDRKNSRPSSDGSLPTPPSQPLPRYNQSGPSSEGLLPESALFGVEPCGAAPPQGLAFPPNVSYNRRNTRCLRLADAAIIRRTARNTSGRREFLGLPTCL